jgi:hypothetical protein
MNDKNDFRPGDVVSVRFGGVLRHYGIVGWDGRIISNTRRHHGVVTQSIDDFADGREIRNHGRSASACDFTAIDRASRRIGHDYHLTGSNCVHFVRGAHGRKPTVTQSARGTFEAFRDMVGPKRPRW